MKFITIFDPICTICRFDFMNTTTNSKIDAINKFILYNVEATQSWVTLYEEERKKWEIYEKKIILLNYRRRPYLDHLK